MQRLHVEDGDVGKTRDGRVDVAVGPDGALYVSDDFTGSIYRVAYGKSAPLPSGRAAVAPQAKRGDPLAGLSAAQREAARTRGSALWEANGCATCHVARPGVASGTIRPLGGLAGKYTIDSLATYLRAPQPPMPYLRAVRAEAAQAATPVQPGMVQAGVTVRVTYEMTR